MRKADFVHKKSWMNHRHISIRVYLLLTLWPFKQWGLCLVKNTTQEPRETEAE